jgi:predicted nucleic acid-binding Zn ribbon protein
MRSKGIVTISYCIVCDKIMVGDGNKKYCSNECSEISQKRKKFKIDGSERTIFIDFCVHNEILPSALIKEYLTLKIKEELENGTDT